MIIFMTQLYVQEIRDRSYLYIPLQKEKKKTCICSKKTCKITVVLINQTVVTPLYTHSYEAIAQLCLRLQSQPTAKSCRVVSDSSGEFVSLLSSQSQGSDAAVSYQLRLSLQECQITHSGVFTWILNERNDWLSRNKKN